MRRMAFPAALLLALALLAGCGAPAPSAPAAEGSEECTYTVLAVDPDGAPVAGVTLNFCTDESCTTVTTDDNGTAVFTGAPFAYHVQVIKVPKGFRPDGETEFTTELRDQRFELRITEAEP